MRRFTRKDLLATVFMASIIGIIGATIGMRGRHTRALAEAGLRKEIQGNANGVKDLRQALPTEIDNISHVAELLDQQKLGHEMDRQSAQLGLQVMSLTNANWQTASATGAIKLMNYEAVERFATAYFEQARLAQIQTSTLDALMALSSYIGHGERIALLTPEQASLAEVQAQLLLAHLRVMLRMSDGVQEAYEAALAGS